MNFVWDPIKAASKQKKHRVSFVEASSVFLDPLAATGADPDHYQGQTRWLTFGLSSAGRLLVVSHGDQADTVRIISARPCTAAERKLYESR